MRCEGPLHPRRRTALLARLANCLLCAPIMCVDGDGFGVIFLVLAIVFGVCFVCCLAQWTWTKNECGECEVRRYISWGDPHDARFYWLPAAMSLLGFLLMGAGWAWEWDHTALIVASACLWCCFCGCCFQCSFSGFQPVCGAFRTSDHCSAEETAVCRDFMSSDDQSSGCGTLSYAGFFLGSWIGLAFFIFFPLVAKCDETAGLGVLDGWADGCPLPVTPASDWAPSSEWNGTHSEWVHHMTVQHGPDACGVCAGDNHTCAGCDSVPHSQKELDGCGVCGGDGSSCPGCNSFTHSDGYVTLCVAMLLFGSCSLLVVAHRLLDCDGLCLQRNSLDAGLNPSRSLERDALLVAAGSDEATATSAAGLAGRVRGGGGNAGNGSNSTSNAPLACCPNCPGYGTSCGARHVSKLCSFCCVTDAPQSRRLNITRRKRAFVFCCAALPIRLARLLVCSCAGGRNTDRPCCWLAGRQDWRGSTAEITSGWHTEANFFGETHIEGEIVCTPYCTPYCTQLASIFAVSYRANMLIGLYELAAAVLLWVARTKCDAGGLDDEAAAITLWAVAAGALLCALGLFLFLVVGPEQLFQVESSPISAARLRTFSGVINEEQWRHDRNNSYPIPVGHQRAPERTTVMPLSAPSQFAADTGLPNTRPDIELLQTPAGFLPGRHYFVRCTSCRDRGLCMKNSLPKAIVLLGRSVLPLGIAAATAGGHVGGAMALPTPSWPFWTSLGVSVAGVVAAWVVQLCRLRRMAQGELDAVSKNAGRATYAGGLSFEHFAAAQRLAFAKLMLVATEPEPESTTPVGLGDVQAILDLPEYRGAWDAQHADMRNGVGDLSAALDAMPIDIIRNIAVLHKPAGAAGRRLRARAFLRQLLGSKPEVARQVLTPPHLCLDIAATR